MNKEDRNAQQVLEDELVSIGIYTKNLAGNPTDALDAIIMWHSDVAVDPKVSDSAQRLRRIAYAEGYRVGYADALKR